MLGTVCARSRASRIVHLGNLSASALRNTSACELKAWCGGGIRCLVQINAGCTAYEYAGLAPSPILPKFRSRKQDQTFDALLNSFY